MGEQVSKVAIGPKSNGNLSSGEGNSDLKDPSNAKRAKQELYELFLEDKILHVAIAEELGDKLEKVRAENKRLKEELEAYKKLNVDPAEREEVRPEISSPEATSSRTRSGKRSGAREEETVSLKEKISKIAEKLSATQKRLRSKSREAD